MKLIRHFNLVPALLLAMLSPVAAWAAAPAEHDHSHGEAAATAPASGSTTTSATAAAKSPESTVGTPATTDDLVQRMNRLHEHMAAEKTPAERQKLMAEGQSLMREGMAALRDLKPGAGTGMGMDNCMAMHKDMMGKRMDMMEMMMQTMMDQQAPVSVGR